VFEALLSGKMTIGELAKSLHVSVATLLTSIAPLVPYRIINVSLGPEKSLALGQGISTNDEAEKLVNELAKDVMKTKATIRKLAEEIAKTESAL